MKTVAAFALLVVASPIYAQTGASSSSTPAPVTAAAVPATAPPTTTAAPAGTTIAAATAAKPKLICEDTETLGSRLGSHKVCMTRDQWRDQQRQTRMAVDHAQLSRGNSGN